MKHSNQLCRIAAILLTTFIFTVSCKKKDKDDAAPLPKVELMKYFVGVHVGGGKADPYYLVPTKDIMSGNISVVGNGFENMGYQAVVQGGYVYATNDAEATIDKYKVTETGMVKEASISTTAVMSGSFARYVDYMEETNDIILSNFPNAEGKAPYAIIDLATFKVESYGRFQMPDVGEYKAMWTRPTVSGGKVYVAAEYHIPAITFSSPDSLITVKFDYPSFTNPTVLINDVSGGSTAGYRTNATFKNEQGDIYQWNFRSPVWENVSAERMNTMPIVFAKISNGVYDKSYEFNVSSHFNEEISMWNAWYAGNGIAYANIMLESELAGNWDNIYENYGQIYKLDIYNKTVTKINIPKAPLNEIYSLNSVDDGKFYIPVCIKNGNANIYEITIGGGANDFKAGAKLDGANVKVPSLNILK